MNLETMKVISMGWGVQSFTLAAMSALGTLPPVDVAIHSDTLNEQKDTYEFATKWLPWLEEHGVKVVTVKPSENSRFLRNGAVLIPAFTLTDDSKKPKKGRLLRVCTQRWKIAPIRRWLQANREGKPVEMWMGISTDEVTRVKPSAVKYIANRWPLIEQGMSRDDCVAWLLANGLAVPPKSACFFCPFHSERQWFKIYQSPDWAKAVAIDTVVRDVRPGYRTYLSDRRVALTELPFDTELSDESHFDEECEGMCGN